MKRGMVHTSVWLQLPGEHSVPVGEEAKHDAEEGDMGRVRRIILGEERVDQAVHGQYEVGGRVEVCTVRYCRAWSNDDVRCPGLHDSNGTLEFSTSSQ